ncbi:MAG: DUF86 domain-containing protein [Patescibacteria group bacterium]|nr:DUF86 domain-containing protein [Patescibacteria group bacterium]
MTSLTKQKILEKLENFEEYLGYLYQLQKEARNEKVFLSDFHLFGNTERYLQLSIQIIIDISHLIIIDLRLRRPEDNYEAISILFENKIISEELSKKLTRMVGLRNILVHEYGKIDRKKIYKILKKELQDLKEFKKQIIKFLKT